jgi:phage-related protein
MKYTIEYFHARVKNDIESWPDGILADFARLVELLMEFGPDLRMPHSRAMGDGLFELRPRGREGIGRALYCYIDGQRTIARFCKENTGNPGKRIAPCQEANEGGTKCLI